MNVNPVENKGNKNYILPPDEGVIDKALPIEIFETILSYLDDMDLQQASLVNRLWSTASIDQAKREEFSKIKDFAKFLGDNLDAESNEEQRAQLLSIGGNKQILQAVSLIEVKSSLNNFKDTFADILKGLNEKDLQRLEDLSKNTVKPKLFDNVFELAKIYKKLDRANAISDDDEYEKSAALRKIVKKLIKIGSLDKAAEVAKAIPLGPFQLDTLRKIVKSLVKSGKVDKAIEVAKMMHPGSSQSEALKNIVESLVKSGKVDKAIEVANINAQYNVFEPILKALVNNRKVDKALSIANKLPKEDTKSLSLTNIVEALVKNWNINKAIEVVNTINIDNYQSMALNAILGALVKGGNVGKAIDVVNTLREGEIKRLEYTPKQLGIIHIVNVLAKKDEIYKAIEIANTIPEKYLKSVALLDIADILAKSGRMAEAKELANTITDDTVKLKALELINGKGNVKKKSKKNNPSL